MLLTTNKSVCRSQNAISDVETWPQLSEALTPPQISLGQQAVRPLLSAGLRITESVFCFGQRTGRPLESSEFPAMSRSSISIASEVEIYALAPSTGTSTKLESDSLVRNSCFSPVIMGCTIAS